MTKDSSNSTLRTLLGIVFTTLPIFCASAIVLSDVPAFGLAKDAEYMISHDSSNKLTTSSSAQYASKTYYTGNGNEYMISFAKCRNAGNYFTTINATGYFTTKTALNGLSEITLKTSSTDQIKVGYGWAEGLENIYSYKVFSGSTSYTFNFDDLGPSFFTVQNTNSSAAVNIVSLTAKYSCTPTERPADIEEAYLVDGPTFNSAISGNYSKVVFSSLDYAKAQGATSANRNLTAKGDINISLYAKGNTAYIAADADKPTIVFNENCKSFFSHCEKLVNIEIAEGAFIDTSKVVSFEEFFYNVRNINEESMNRFLNNFNTKSARNFASMFKDNQNMKIVDLSFVEFTNKDGVDLQQMFYNCYSLTEIKFSSKKMSKLAIADSNHQWYGGAFGMAFQNCESLTELDLSSFNFNSSTPINALNAFAGCRKLKTIYTDDNAKNFITNGWEAQSTFQDCYALVGGNGTAYSSSHMDASYARVDKNGQKGYFTAK